MGCEGAKVVDDEQNYVTPVPSFISFLPHREKKEIGGCRAKIGFKLRKDSLNKVTIRDA